MLPYKYKWIDDDPRLADALIQMPSYYVGQCEINDGPTFAWEFAIAKVETANAWVCMEAIAEMLRKFGYIADTNSGDSPGSLPYVTVIVTDGTDSLSIYFDDVPDTVSDGAYYIARYDADGEPVQNEKLRGVMPYEVAPYVNFMLTDLTGREYGKVPTGELGIEIQKALRGK